MVSVILAGAAVFISEQAAILPVLVVWFEITARRGKLAWGDVIRRLWPYVAVVGIYFLSKWRTLGLLTAGQYLEGHAYLSLMADFLALAKYIGILIFPCYLAVNHVLAPGIYSVGFDDFDSFAVLSLNFLQPYVLMSLLAVGGLIYLAWRMYPRTPLVTFCLGWLLISLVPVMNILPTNCLLAERFLYAGMLGFSLLLALLVTVIYDCGVSAESKQPRPPVQGAAILSVGLAVLLTVVYLVRTEWRISDWRDDVALLESAVAVNPGSAKLRNSLGLTYSATGRMQEAENQIRMAIGMKPHDAFYYFTLEEVLSDLGRYDESEATLLKAIELDPDYAQAYYNLAGLYAYRGKTHEAYSFLQKAVDVYQSQGMLIEAGEAIDSLVSYLNSKKSESKE
jgi:tetratricopeptide (TPR) repeat protein